MSFILKDKIFTLGYQIWDIFLNHNFITIKTRNMSTYSKCWRMYVFVYLIMQTSFARRCYQIQLRSIGRIANQGSWQYCLNSTSVHLVRWMKKKIGRKRKKKQSDWIQWRNAEKIVISRMKGDSAKEDTQKKIMSKEFMIKHAKLVSSPTQIIMKFSKNFFLFKCDFHLAK